MTPRRLAPYDHHMHRLRNRALNSVLRSVLFVQRAAAEDSRLWVRVAQRRADRPWPDGTQCGSVRSGRPALRLVKTSRA